MSQIFRLMTNIRPGSSGSGCCFPSAPFPRKPPISDNEGLAEQAPTSQPGIQFSKVVAAIHQGRPHPMPATAATAGAAAATSVHDNTAQEAPPHPTRHSRGEWNRFPYHGEIFIGERPPPFLSQHQQQRRRWRQSSGCYSRRSLLPF